MKIFVLAIVISVLCLIVKNYKPEYALVCQLCGITVIAGAVLSYFEDVIDSLTDMSFAGGLDSSFVGILLKALGVSIMTDIASNICKDSGNNTLSICIDLFGKTVIVFMSLPMLKKLMEAAIGFMN